MCFSDMDDLNFTDLVYQPTVSSGHSCDRIKLKNQTSTLRRPEMDTFTKFPDFTVVNFQFKI